MQPKAKIEYLNHLSHLFLLNLNQKPYAKRPLPSKNLVWFWK